MILFHFCFRDSKYNKRMLHKYTYVTKLYQDVMQRYECYACESHFCSLSELKGHFDSHLRALKQTRDALEEERKQRLAKQRLASCESEKRKQQMLKQAAVYK